MKITPEYKINLARRLRQRQTPSEETLWAELRGRRLAGWKFRRQHPVERFVADFLCEEAKLVVEVDGGYHHNPEQRELDRERAAYFTGNGYTILRVTDADVMERLAETLRRIETAADTARNNDSRA